MIFRTCNIKIPKHIDVQKWSVVACDQYTSQPQYWHRVESFVGDAPSTLHMVIPEIYLESDDVDSRIQKVNETMERYLKESVTRTIEDGCLYVERTLENGLVRRGLMLAVDLECYDFSAGSRSPIRATEGTVLSRIPPRVKVRENAPMEVPHVMLLIDDERHQVIEPITQVATELERVYRTRLMERGGAVTAFLLGRQEVAQVTQALNSLLDEEYYTGKYGYSAAEHPLLFAVGDGNHSLACAKQCYENLKRRVGEQQARKSPARYALVEVVNLHDRSLQFEAIHRVVFDCDTEKLLAHLQRRYPKGRPGVGQRLVVVTQDGEQEWWIEHPSHPLEVGTLQEFLDNYLADHEGRLDYIHGEEVVRELSSRKGNVGFLLPSMEKERLFPAILQGGALPRKTFSMGHPWDKRFYLECRLIRDASL
ncbi:MAG: DUF1015 domain-containing protein [Eubacteriales bacterium]